MTSRGFGELLVFYCLSGTMSYRDIPLDYQADIYTAFAALNNDGDFQRIECEMVSVNRANPPIASPHI